MGRRFPRLARDNLEIIISPIYIELSACFLCFHVQVSQISGTRCDAVASRRHGEDTITQENARERAAPR